MAMIYPESLRPDSTETLKIEESEHYIPKCNILFERWRGASIQNTFGGKTVLNVNSEPSFAEIAIAEIFINAGWDARWVETYGRGNLNPFFLRKWKDDKYKNQVNFPIEEKWVSELLKEIAYNNEGSFSGCWDVVAWKEEQIIFAESKRLKQDSIRQTQFNWLQAGLKSGLNELNFLVVQWSLG